MSAPFLFAPERSVIDEWAEIVRLMLVLVVGLAFGVWVVRRYMRTESTGAMAARINALEQRNAALEQENAGLKAEIVRLRVLVDEVLARNNDLQCKIKDLDLQQQATQDQLHSTQKQIDDYRVMLMRGK